MFLVTKKYIVYKVISGRQGHSSLGTPCDHIARQKHQNNNFLVFFYVIFAGNGQGMYIFNGLLICH